MAIAALALRLATVYALRGLTQAGANVSDSTIEALDVRIEENRQPTIVVYTDGFKGSPTGRDLQRGDRTFQVVLELAVADQVAHEGTITVTIPETSAGLELTLDLLQAQIERILMQDSSPWAKLWRDLVLKVLQFEGERGASVKEGVRFAARQLALTCQTIEEPPADGWTPVGVWARFLDLVAATADLAELEPLIRAAIEGDALPAWRQVQALFGLTDEGAQGVGVSPPFTPGPLEDAPGLQAIEVAGDDATRLIEPEA